MKLELQDDLTEKKKKGLKRKRVKDEPIEEAAASLYVRPILIKLKSLKSATIFITLTLSSHIPAAQREESNPSVKKKQVKKKLRKKNPRRNPER